MKKSSERESLREEVYRLLDAGMPGEDIRARFGLTIMQFAGYKAAKTKIDYANSKSESEQVEKHMYKLFYVPSSISRAENSQLVKMLEKASRKITLDQVRDIVVELKSRGFSNEEIHNQPILKSVDKWTIAGILSHYSQGTYS